MTTSGTAYYYPTDAPGSVIVLTDEHGSKTNTYAGTTRTDKPTEKAPSPTASPPATGPPPA
ncbi:hypothetical protein WDH52_21755 [Streptomyces sp. TRM70308]|uniref:hypothetical protein n=1 Tax=Streptomyces sp. TRM70308 TaxID=3131932 RepID=UPI003D01DC20